jgi:glycine dehydrogenase
MKRSQLQSKLPDGQAKDLELATRSFADRHIGPSSKDVEEMLAVIGVNSVDELIAQTMPSSIRLRRPLNLAPEMTEPEALASLRAMASKNEMTISLIGMGYYGTVLPPVIQRNILENPAWYTAYTPYQPEISQGRLEALLNFQTMVCDLTGLDVANGSLLDEATAAAEAMALAKRTSVLASNRYFVDSNVHPQTLAVLRTRAEPLGWEIVLGDAHSDFRGLSCFGALFQYPGTFGAIPDLRGRLLRSMPLVGS